MLSVPLELGIGVGDGVGMGAGGSSWDFKVEYWDQCRREGAGSRVGPGIAYWVGVIDGDSKQVGSYPVSQFYYQFTYAITNYQP